MPIKLLINNEIVFIKEYLIQTINNKTIIVFNSEPIKDCESYIDLSNLSIKEVSSYIYELTTEESALPQSYIDKVVATMLDSKKDLDNLCNTIRSQTLYS
jgi:hypothetical protein